MTVDLSLPAGLALPTGRPRDVLCVGTALVDHLVLVPDGLPAELGFAKGSMSLVDVAGAAAIRAAVGEGRVRSGGTVANTAVGVASFGGRAVYVGSVGDDEEGGGFAADLEAAGVEAILERHPAGEGEAATGRCVVMVTPDSERTMATALGLGPYLDHGAIDAELVGRVQLAYFDGYVLDFPDGPAILERLVEASRTAGTVLAFGLADAFAVERHRAEVEALVGGPVGLCFANAAEATVLTGSADAAAAAGAIAREGVVAVVTCGADGVVVATTDGQVEVPAEPVVEVVDATGAGDLFTAGFCVGLTRGLDLARSARLGALAASEVISHLGARPEQSLAKLAEARGLLGAPGGAEGA